MVSKKSMADVQPTVPKAINTNFRRNTLVAAISIALCPAGAQAEGWSRNIEVFAMPTSKRDLIGFRWLEPVWQDNRSMFYLDGRAVVDLGNTQEFNFGGGYRRLLFDRQWIFGGYASFDTRETFRNLRHNQITLGVEALSREWDFRANGYIPLNDPKTVGPASFGGRFSGTRLFAGRQTEEPLHGADFEIGRLLDFIPFGETRLFVGGYHFDGDVVTKSTGFGKKVRLEYRPKKNIALEIGAQDDNLFDSEVHVKISFSFGYPAESGVRTIDERMSQFAERDVDIRETSRLSEDLTTATGPGNDLLISNNVIHIDNSNTDPGGGDGSVDNPYTSIANCNSARCQGTGSEGAFIYVHEGDTPYATEGFTLANQQRLIGQGFNLYGIGGDAFPQISPGNYGAELANGNEIAGLNFYGNDVGVIGFNNTGFNIHDNQFTGNTIGVGIGSTGNNSIAGSISNNLFQAGYGEAQPPKYGEGPIILAPGPGPGGPQIGIKAYNEGNATQSLDITNNRFGSHYSEGPGLYAGVKAYNGADGNVAATQTLNITGNSFSNSYVGVKAYNSADDSVSANATQNLNLSSNTISNGYIGVYAENVAEDNGVATQNLNLSGNTINNNIVGVSAYNEAKYGGNATQTIDLTNANLSNNLGTAVYASNSTGIYNTGTATQSLDLTGADVSGSGSGIDIGQNDPTQTITGP